MADTREREMRFSDRMSDHEALMWNIEKDPWLNPSGAALTILQGSIDDEHFRRTMRRAVAKMPRLYERVVPGLGRLAPPAWVPDPEFDLDYHMRRLRLPKPGTDRQLFDLAAQLYQEPLDRTRPLWRFVVIDGLEGGRSAIWSILHHAVADGIGQLRMAEMYQQLDPDAPPPDDIDLEAIVAAAVETHHAKQLGGDLTDGFAATLGQSLAHLVRRELGVVRRVAGEVVIWPADPQRARDTIEGVLGALTSTVGALTGSGNEVAGGSPLWKERSRHRHLEHVSVPLDELKAAAKRLDVTINDVFLAAMTEGAVRYHADRGVEVDAFNTSFVFEHAPRHCHRRQLVHAGAGPGARRRDAARRAHRRHPRTTGREAGVDVDRRRDGGPVGHRQPAAHLGGHERRSVGGRQDRLRHLEPARCAVRPVRVGCAGPQDHLDGSGRRHGVQRNGVVLREQFRHRSVHRSDRGRRAR